ncbi:hypothetical protein [Brevibacillus formosus]
MRPIFWKAKRAKRAELRIVNLANVMVLQKNVAWQILLQLTVCYPDRVQVR